MSETWLFFVIMTFGTAVLFLLSVRDLARLRRIVATGWRVRENGIFWMYVHPCGTEYASLRKAWKRFKVDLHEAEVKMYG